MAKQPGRMVRAVNWCGSRSLLLYVWHLVLLHSGLGVVRPLREIFARVQTPGRTAGLYLLTLGGAVLLTWVWEKGKEISHGVRGGHGGKKRGLAS